MAEVSPVTAKCFGDLARERAQVGASVRGASGPGSGVERWADRKRKPRDDSEQPTETPDARKRREWYDTLRANVPLSDDCNDDVSPREMQWIIRDAFREDPTAWGRCDPETELIRQAVTAEREAEAITPGLEAEHDRAHEREYQRLAEKAERELAAEARQEAKRQEAEHKAQRKPLLMDPRHVARREYVREYKRRQRAGLPTIGTRPRIVRTADEVRAHKNLYMRRRRLLVDAGLPTATIRTQGATLAPEIAAAVREIDIKLTGE
jgi:hypothetical protein